MVAWEAESVQVAISREKTLRIDLEGFGLIFASLFFPEANVPFYANIDCSSSYDKELIIYFT